MSEKPKEKNFRLKLLILILLLAVNLILPAKYMMTRIYYCKWNDAFNIDNLEQELIAAYDTEPSSETTDSTTITTIKPDPQKTDIDTLKQKKIAIWKKKLLGSSKLANEFSGSNIGNVDSKISAVKRQIKIFRLVTQHQLIKKEDLEILTQIVEMAKEDWSIASYEADVILHAIEELNNNTKKNEDFFPF